MTTNEKIMLHKFLKKEGALKEYIKYTIKDIKTERGMNYGHYDTLKDFLDKRSLIPDIICWSFTWGETPQGHDFWSDLNSKFERLVKRQK